MESVQKDILEKVEQTLRVEFMSNLAKTTRRDAYESMADIFNFFDRQTENRFMTTLEENDREAAERIKTLMFTFEDLGKLDSASTQTLLRHVEKDKLGLALKGCSDTLRDFFFSNMSERAGKMLKEDMEVMGPVRLKEVDEAQMFMVNTAKDLAASGEIMISKNRGEDGVGLLGHHNGNRVYVSTGKIRLRHRVRRSLSTKLRSARAREKEPVWTEEELEREKAEAYARGLAAGQADALQGIEQRIADAVQHVMDRSQRMLEDVETVRAGLEKRSQTSGDRHRHQDRVGDAGPNATAGDRGHRIRCPVSLVFPAPRGDPGA